MAASKCAFEDWCGTGSRYWYTATERKQKKNVWGVPMGLVGSSPAESDPVVARQILRAHSTRHGARPGPILAPWFIGGRVRVSQPRARETTCGRKSKVLHSAKKLVS